MKKETGNIELNVKFEYEYVFFKTYYFELFTTVKKNIFCSVLRWMNDVAVYIENLPKRHDAIALK